MNTEFLKILNSSCSNIDYVNNLRYLLNSTVLSEDEVELCEKMLHQVEVFHQSDLSKVLKELDVGIDTSNFDITDKMNNLQMYEKIDKLIFGRLEEQNKMLIEEALEKSAEGVYEEKALDAFFNRYVSNIKIEDDTIFEDLYSPQTVRKKETISTANGYIDEVTGGIEKGSITSIVGTYDDFKSIWALNLAYKCLKNKQNVLYISLGTTKLELYKRFLTRHSKDRKFEKPLTIEEINDESNKDLYLKIYGDFQNFFKDRLIIYDDTYLAISTQYALQKLIVYAHNEFIKRFNEGIDVIIVDDFSNMTIDNGKKTITSRSRVVNTYYKYLKHQAQSLLGYNKQVPIIVTISAAANSMISLENNCDFCLDFVDEEVKVLSDNIFTVYGNINLRRNGNMRLKVLKSTQGIMEQSKLETVDITHCHMKYAECDNDDEIEKDDTIEQLTKQNEELEKANQETNQHMIDILAGRNTPCEEQEFTLDELMEGLIL